MKKNIFLFLLALPVWGFAQQDTTKILDDVVIKAFAYDRPLKDVPASIAKISPVDLERFSNTNILPALNAQPGVRMEERSPGSYRLSIRGSTLRSPFGIRNVKVYWNGLPLTDYGGNTYLNLLDFSSIDNLEIIKGPGSSLYGAGTGGVLLLGRNTINKNKVFTDVQGGSFGLFRYRVGVEKTFSKFNIGADFVHQEADGYREHSAMKRDMIGIRSKVLVGKKSSLAFNFFHSNLSYETPGGLTQIQYDTMPSMARPGADSKKAAIYNKTFFGGITLESEWGRWTNIASLLGNLTDFENPTFANFEKRDEKGLGFRDEIHRTGEKGKFTAGFEFQTGRSLISVGSNIQGRFVDIGNDVRFRTTTYFLFAQYDWNLPGDFFLTTGLSANSLTMKYDTLLVDDYVSVNKRMPGLILSPRVALLKKLNGNLSAYVIYSTGYSPPTTDEVFPSPAIYNSKLKPEYGTNYEVGLKGAWTWIQPSLTFYSFQLDQTIVKTGTDEFTNAGRTSQNGIEALIKIDPTSKGGLKGWISYSLNDYIFKDFVQSGNDYSGNSVTGVSPNVLSAGLDFKWKGFYSNATFNYVDRAPLNDANAVYSDEYFLLGARLGYKVGKNETPFEVFAGVDNLLNEKYSLGNDINPIGGVRFFNAAATRNFYFGLKVRLGYR